MRRPENIHRTFRWGAAALLGAALALGLAACGGGGSSTDAVAAAEPPAPVNTSVTTGAQSPATPVSTVQPAQTDGRLLASNCFQCHGTQGTGGFDSIRGSKASEVLEYMTKPANRDIMAAHAQGYTREQLQMIIAYLQQ